jgi:flagellar hook-associated protein 1 FlgK
LNKEIISETNSGATPNALLDQRDAILTKLSDLVGITVQPTASNGVAVLVGGSALVRDNTTQTLQVDDTGNPVQLRWDDDNNPLTVTDGQVVKITGGDASGQMDLINTDIPKYQTMLNTFTSNLISTVNTQHEAGQDLNGDPGVAFFTGTDASNIAVNTVVANDPSKIAAAASGGAQLDSDNASAMANLSELDNGPDTSYASMINVIGTDAQRAANQATINESITNNADAAVQSTSGVNLDEEMTNMVQYQRAYESAAKYLSVINTTLDSLMQIVG